MRNNQKKSYAGLVLAFFVLPTAVANATTCPSQEVYWPAGERNKCVADSVIMGAGQTRVLSSRGTSVVQQDGTTRITNRGEATIFCSNDGRIEIRSQNCTAGVDSLASIRAILPTSQSVTNSDPSTQSENSQRTADQINNLERLASFEKRTDREIDKGLDGLSSITQNYGVVGAGIEGQILQSNVPFDATKLRLEISTKFGHGDGGGVLTTYIEHRICTPRQCSTVRNFLDRTKGGSSGHYWGYEMTGFKTEELNLPINKGELVTIVVTGNYLARENNVRLYFIQ